MKKSTLQKMRRCILILTLLMPFAFAWGQATFTITRGSSGDSNTLGGANISAVPGIAVTENIPSSCPTGDNASQNYYMTITPQAGYVITITSVSGNATRSSAGKNQINWQLVNGGTTLNGSTACIPSSSSCNGTTTIPTISTNQTVVAAGSTVNVVRNICTNGNTPSGNGYTAVKELTITGTITGIGTVAPTSINFGNVNVASTSNASSFVLQPSAIAGSNILVTAPAGFLVSQTSGGTYTQTIAFANNTTAKTIYAKFAPTTAGAASGQIVVSKETNGGTVTNRTVNVNGNGVAVNPPSVTSSLTDTSTYGATDTYQIAASNSPNAYTATYDGGALPEGITFNASTGLISVAATVAVGIYNIEINASNAGGGPGTAQTLAYTRTAKPLTLTGGDANDKIYDGTTTVTFLTEPLLSGIINGDVVNLTGTPVAEFVTKNAGTRQVRFTGGYAVDNSNYTLIYPQEPTDLTADITPITATITGITIDDKDFDSNTTATISGTPVLNGIISGDDATLNSTSASAMFIQVEPGENIPVTVSGYSLSGTDSGNYTLAQPTGLTATINDDGLTDQTITFNPLSNVVYGDASFALTATTDAPLTITYTSSNENVATVSGNTVTITGVGTTTIIASQDGDATHSPAIPVTQNLTVMPKALTVADAAVVTKIYDGTDVATVTATLDGVVGSDDVTYTYEAIYEDKNVGVDKDAVAEFNLTGTRAYNYTLPVDLISLTGTINPKELTVSGAAATNKVYDTTNAATVTGTLTGVVSGDVVTLIGTGTFADVNADTGIAVTATATLGGADAANYALTQPTGLSANITTKGISVTATATSKVYDRTTLAEITVTGINGVISPDEVTVAGSGTFNTYAAGNNKPVTTALILSGAQADNYSITQPTGLVANITQKAITADISAATVADKTYNNTTTAVVNGVVLNDVLAGDEADVVVTTASFAQAAAGNDIVVSNFVLSGTAAANYTLTQPVDTLLGNIVPATLTLNSAAAQNKVYDGTDAANITGTLAGVIAGAPAVSYTGTGTFESIFVANGIAVTPAIVLTGAGAGNYVLTQPTGLTANITPKGVTVTATAQSKLYDDTTTTTVTDAAITAGVLGDDEVLLEATTVPGTFNNATVGTNKPVSATFTLTGEKAANYTVIVQTYPANITPVTLTVDVTNAAVTTKTYDATTTAAITGAVLSGILPGDNVIATTGTFASANAGIDNAVTILLTGTDAGNYTLTQPETPVTGIINKKALTATADNKTKVQGAANPALTITYSGFAGSQTAASALNFVAPSIATTAITASPVGAYPITLSGGSATNYTFSALNNGWLSVNPASTALITWSPAQQSGFGVSPWAPTTIAAGLNTQMIKGSSILSGGTAAGSAWGGGNGGGNSWINNGATTDNNSFNFELAVPAGKSLSLSGIVGNFRRSNTGPSDIYVYYAVYPTGSAVPSTFSLAASQAGLTVPSTAANGNSVTLNLASAAGLQNIQGGYTVKIRLNPGTAATTGTFYINGAGSPSTFVVNGTLSDKPVITSSLTDSSDILSTDTYQITATGTPQLNYSATNLPTGATIGNTGLISFDGTTPAGIYPITIGVTSYYGSDSKTLVYTVNKLNQVITFDPDPIPLQYVGNEPLLLEYNNSAPLPIVWASSSESVATISASGIITAVSEGTSVITASNDGNDVYNPVTQTINITVGAPCFTWLGTNDSNWNNPANWCNGIVPFADSEVIINPGSHNPVISAGMAHANNLTLNANAQLTVNTGATLSVEGNLHVDDTATLTVQNNGAIVQGTAATANNNTGKIEFHKLSNPLYRLDYTLWSAPITGQTLRTFSMGTSNNRFYIYDYAFNGTAYVQGY
ncbi:beta strand repeat-containing protein, partial [Flavobacterium sp. RHBU_24]|uniref:beta strand repeat-containing protein n=1 Tax=Flavobacterium sp. RHBU_24 TaxID=3391185 RepID=UPI00398530BA